MTQTTHDSNQQTLVQALRDTAEHAAYEAATTAQRHERGCWLIGVSLLQPLSYAAAITAVLSNHSTTPHSTPQPTTYYYTITLHYYYTPVHTNTHSITRPAPQPLNHSLLITIGPCTASYSMEVGTGPTSTSPHTSPAYHGSTDIHSSDQYCPSGGCAALYSGRRHRWMTAR